MLSLKGERIRIMTEPEYNIEVLCTCYSLEELHMQRCKLCDGTKHNGPDIIDDITIDVLDKAIACYGEEKYKQIREQMVKNRISMAVFNSITFCKLSVNFGIK